jgi:carbonic anhydrase
VGLREELLAANRGQMASFNASGLSVQPARRLAVLTCMDSRYTVQGMLGFEMGDVHVIRNAGGRVTDDAIRSLTMSAALLGTRSCVVIHHTRCGLYGTTNDALRAAILEVSGTRPEIDFLPFADLEASVREDVARLRACPAFPPDYEVVGFTYDVDTGRLHPVADETPITP